MVILNRKTISLNRDGHRSHQHIGYQEILENISVANNILFPRKCVLLLLIINFLICLFEPGVRLINRGSLDPGVPTISQATGQRLERRRITTQIHRVFSLSLMLSYSPDLQTEAVPVNSQSTLSSYNSTVSVLILTRNCCGATTRGQILS